MKINQPKLRMLLLCAGAFLVYSCSQKEGNFVEYDPVDIKKHKLKPQLAEKLSKRYVKDMKDLFAKADSLEYYKALVEQMRNEKTAQRNVKQSEPVTFKRKKPKFELSVSSWYSVDELMTYMGEAIKTVETSGGKVSGFRIYIGVFPEKGDGRKDNTLTTFMVPTGYMGDGREKGSLLNFSLPLYAEQDITGVDGLEYGQSGEPPQANYPQ